MSDSRFMTMSDVVMTYKSITVNSGTQNPYTIGHMHISHFTRTGCLHMVQTLNCCCTSRLTKGQNYTQHLDIIDRHI